MLENVTTRHLIETIDVGASDNFRKDGFVAPIYAILLKDGTLHISLLARLFESEKTKDNINAFLRIASRRIYGESHIGGVLVVEGWLTTLPRYAQMLPLEDVVDVIREIGPVSKAPNKIEAILYVAELRKQDGRIERSFGYRVIDNKTRILSSTLHVYEHVIEDQEEVIATASRQIGFGIL